MMPEGWSSLGYLVPAAILLGIGSYLNGACVFGSVGHLGNGEIEFAFTFLGIYAVVHIESLLDLLTDRPAIDAAPSLGAALPSLLLLTFVIVRLGVSHRSKSGFRRLSLSMGAVGITSSILAVLAPGFSLTASFGPIASIPVAGALVSFSMFGAASSRET